MAGGTSPLLQTTDVVDAARRITRPWVDWFVSVLSRIDSTPEIIPRAGLNLTGQAASRPATAFDLGARRKTYRLTYYVRIEVPASGGGPSSDVNLTIGWKEKGIAQSVSTTPLATNTTTSVATGSFMVVADSDADITWATTYNSVGTTPMQYRLRVVVEALD